MFEITFQFNLFNIFVINNKLKNMILCYDRSGIYNNFLGLTEETHQRKNRTPLTYKIGHRKLKVKFIIENF